MAEHAELLKHVDVFMTFLLFEKHLTGVFRMDQILVFLKGSPVLTWDIPIHEINDNQVIQHCHLQFIDGLA